MMYDISIPYQYVDVLTYYCVAVAQLINDRLTKTKHNSSLKVTSKD